MRVLVSACLAIAIDLGSRGASADGSGVIAASAGDRTPVAAAMTQAMAGRANRLVGDAVTEARAAIAAGAVRVETLAGFRRVREQVDEGWRAYLRVAIEVAAQRLASARTEAEPLVALPGGAELYADAALRLGAVLGHLGRTAESRAILQLALALDPDRPITLAEFSPDVVTLVDQARAAPVTMQKLRVTTSPPGAIVAIDGKDAGRSPLELDVARGQHVVVARAPGHRAAVQGIAVDAVATVELALDRDEPAGRLAGGATLGLPERAQQELVDAAMRF
ncbi:MAG TPA: PEGA domain-containing protein, partial [Kofleriaceae bacterium]